MAAYKLTFRERVHGIGGTSGNVRSRGAVSNAGWRDHTVTVDLDPANLPEADQAAADYIASTHGRAGLFLTNASLEPVT